MASLLQRTPGSHGVDTDTRDDAGLGRGGIRIRCPRCGWEPRADDLWLCLCGHAWNTFDTGGVCPACRHEWQHTACLRCAGWSLHRDWYARDAD